MNIRIKSFAIKRLQLQVRSKLNIAEIMKLCMKSLKAYIFSRFFIFFMNYMIINEVISNLITRYLILRINNLLLNIYFYKFFVF